MTAKAISFAAIFLAVPVQYMLPQLQLACVERCERFRTESYTALTAELCVLAATKCSAATLGILLLDVIWKVITTIKSLNAHVIHRPLLLQDDDIF